MVNTGRSNDKVIIGGGGVVSSSVGNSTVTRDAEFKDLQV